MAILKFGALPLKTGQGVGEKIAYKNVIFPPFLRLLRQISGGKRLFVRQSQMAEGIFQATV